MPLKAYPTVTACSSAHKTLLPDAKPAAANHKRRINVRLKCSNSSCLEQYVLLFLLGLLALIRGSGRCVHRLGLVGAGAGIDVRRHDVDISILTQLGEILTQRWLHFRHVEAFLNHWFDFLQWRYAFRLVLGHLQDHPALICANRFGELTGLESKDLVLKLLRQGTAFKVFQITTVGGSRTVGVL